MNDYKVGDQVVRLSKGDLCEIIATKEVPHQTKTKEGVLTGEFIFVPDDCDYIVVSIPELTSNSGFSPYYFVRESDLT